VVTIKKPQEIKIIKEGGRRLARVLDELSLELKPGVSANRLDTLAQSLILNYGGRPSFLHYKPDFASQSFPAGLCVSPNEIIVHGVPKKEMILKSGDIVSLDIGMEYKNFYTDMSASWPIGEVKPELLKLIKVTKTALARAILVARAGNRLGDIGYAIQSYVNSQGFMVIKDLIGHGVGYGVHEDPDVLNYGRPNTGLKLEPGMVLAIEPMVTFFNPNIKQKSDGSFVTIDNLPAAHFEHTIIITKGAAQIATKI